MSRRRSRRRWSLSLWLLLASWGAARCGQMAARPQACRLPCCMCSGRPSSTAASCGAFISAQPLFFSAHCLLSLSDFPLPAEPCAGGARRHHLGFDPAPISAGQCQHWPQVFALPLDLRRGVLELYQSMYVATKECGQESAGVQTRLVRRGAPALPRSRQRAHATPLRAVLPCSAAFFRRR